MTQLPVDCLNEIFEHLKDDKHTLYSCVLVNRLWCEVSVRIFWRDIRDYSTSNFSTLIACLPNESKKILYDNGIIISALTSKFPTFNYASFCKILSISRVYYNKIEKLLNSKKNISRQKLRNKTNIVSQEILKMLMNQVTTFNGLDIFLRLNINFILYPGAKDCLKNLTKLRCRSDISTELFYQLSQICHNIRSFTLEYRETIPNEIADLISVQRNLKCFNMKPYPISAVNTLTNVIPSLMSKLPNTLIKFKLDGRYNRLSLLFITNFSNLQELKLSFELNECLGDFEKVQYTLFPQLQILKIEKACPKYEFLINFLEINGNNLKEIYLSDIGGNYGNNSLNSAITTFCPNLRKLSTRIKYNELETLKMIFNSCKDLASIKICCGGIFLSEKEALETFVEYSQNIYELILYHLFGLVHFELLPEELESFFKNWIDRKPLKSLSLIIVKRNAYVNSFDKNHENIEIINKYIKLGVIKKFKVVSLIL
ncbi:hypothetical protein RclHR1_13150008 [Rhizophagus clarus]|uniref:F-box domain-containing protein n=1 Tax=Rhizophagus clarus TaxID=94130 RepID=A0A2Z6QDW7_9GLOM|nr:hypothetical protein RclHR1_13150008 [Rhizophagus clarus]GET00397.1 hypothetical protein GLOIN_2v1531010 [Rhizophagus clarus]